ncbi:MAG TPA: hypothetical protein VK171_16595, partial [Fimbriimonas sp.]|nr:hypothetical protein [Fimbriimonas sp.]
MRVGIDFRGAQSGGGSGQRGIGRYTLEMLKGILEFAPEVQLVLFVKHDVEIPAELKGKCEIIPVVAASWSDAKKPLWLKIPKIRSIKRFHEMRFRSAVRKQKVAMEKALSSTKLDVLHIPSALDIGSYPIYNYPCPVVMTFLDAIVIKLKHNTYDRYPWFLQTYYQEQGENLKKADAIVAISDASAKDAIEVFH